MGFPYFAVLRGSSRPSVGTKGTPIPAALGDAKVLLALPFYSLANSTGSAYASPPFRGSLTVIAGERAAPSTGSGSVSSTGNASRPSTAA